jgi:hypothetical protein
MSGDKLAISSVDNIISYLRPSEQMHISVKYRELAINSSKEKIRKAVSGWTMYYDSVMSVDFYHVPKIVYKKCYPLKYRQAFIEQTMDMLAPVDIRYLEICGYDKKYGLVETFNKTIDLLSEDELFSIGW